MQGLAIYGNGFCSKFEAAACPNALLDAITLVDTPGVLSGEKQRIGGATCFVSVSVHVCEFCHHARRAVQ